MTWAEKSFEELVEFHDHKRVPLSTLVRDTRQGDYPYYGAQGIIDSIDDYIFDGEYVLIAEDGANLVTRKQPVSQVVRGQFWVNNHAHVVKAKEGESTNGFLNLLLNHTDLRGYVTGAAQPKLSQGNLRIAKFLCPSYQEQRRIEAVISAYDDLIENNRRRIALLEAAARQLYREWFVRLRFPGHEHTRIIDGVPEGWDSGTIADFYDTMSGGTPSRKVPDFYTGEINWVKTQELNENYIFETEEKITEEALARSSAKLFPENTVLVSIYGGTNIGRTGILARPSATNQACCALFGKEPRAGAIYTSLYFRESREKLISLAQGAAQTNISQQVIRGLSIVLPTPALATSFNEALEPAFEQIKNLQLQNRRLQTARELLLPRLMNGEIPV